jgi:hypothetical protein
LLIIRISRKEKISAKKRGGGLEINKEMVDVKVIRNIKILELENLNKF